MVVVLLQAGKGGGLAAMGAAGAGTDSIFGSRQATTLLTKATWWTGGIFLVLCFVLSLMSGGSTHSSSILREGLQPPASSPTVPTTSEVAPLQPSGEAGGEAGASEGASSDESGGGAPSGSGALEGEQ